MRGLLVRAAVVQRGLEAEVRVAPGEVVALLGPNGAGKSTLLAVAAGLLRPDRGRVELDGEVLLAVGERGGAVDVPPHRRGTALLAQEALLFPHLTARDNVAFGPRAAGAARTTARKAAGRWLERVDVAHLADRRPAQLSGGQAQRVAVARALAAQPRALLLDEPLAALDVSAAPEVRHVLRRVLSGAAPDPSPPVLLVTHDPLDALALADRAVVLEAGRVVEEGPVREVLARPRSAFAARLAGLNLLVGTAAADGLRAAAGAAVAGVLDTGCAPGEPAVAVFSPAAVAVHRDHPTAGASSPRNALPVVVEAVEPRGSLVRVLARAAGGAAGAGGRPVLAADVTAASAADLELVPGARVWFAVKAAEVAVHAARR
ncbi:ATP-binding cassette domain-containing protein [Streptomyces sp. NP160]|uniref:sulfate/molybdate ABC transporter ATP-binding protein n=1 Tax=Streptomyces sp. NP160 TaxID=2586637 RepID=UPI00111BAC94|nr:ATP-binding cassette domain-containing protein [Streptomyces sp. NP160]TNM69938.1 ATP-binding cassette domain-containing protein [Streptomyces sp. NP160]